MNRPIYLFFVQPISFWSKYLNFFQGKCFSTITTTILCTSVVWYISAVFIMLKNLVSRRHLRQGNFAVATSWSASSMCLKHYFPNKHFKFSISVIKLYSGNPLWEVRSFQRWLLRVKASNSSLILVTKVGWQHCLFLGCF